MNKDELLDLVNEKDEVVGTVRRSEAHKDSSKIHREVAILLFTKDGRVLLEERSFKKDHEPGAWRIPAGHILSGEDPENMAKKEVFEELGIKINPVFYGKKFSISEGRESRFFWIYYAILNENIKINVNKDESETIEWIKVGELDKFSKDHKYSLTSPSHELTMEVYKYLVQNKIVNS